jgi:hypothetical protein
MKTPTQPSTDTLKRKARIAKQEGGGEAPGFQVGGVARPARKEQGKCGGNIE